MPIVDGHTHASLAWYEPAEVLLFHMARNGVEHAVLVQMHGQYDNSYQSDCVRRYPGKFASVVQVEASRPDAPDRLAQEAALGASGVRLDPTDPPALFEIAARLGLSISCHGTSAAFGSSAFARVVESIPAVPIVLERMGSLSRFDDSDADLRRRIFGLARFPNVHIKIHGLGWFARRAKPVTEPFPFVRPVPPALDWAYDAFGPNRMMWGSDSGHASSAEGYANALRLPMHELDGKSQADRDAIFGGTALSVFPPR
jgi:L-fuconolactonase